jgi:hypothetical protein
MPAVEFRRRYGHLIKRKLEGLRSAWETTHDPCLIVDAMWLCRECGYRRPSWLREVAPKHAIDMGRVNADVYGWVWEKKNEPIGRPSPESIFRAEAKALLRDGLPTGRYFGMTKPEFAGELVKWARQEHQIEAEPSTVAGYISDLWREYVVEPRKLRRRKIPQK